MNVGDYVRMSWGISKVSSIYQRADGNMVFDTDNGYQNYFTELRKSSPNIIDLIEVGDVITLKERDGDLVKYEIEEFQQRNIYGEKTHEIVLGILYRERYKPLPEIEPIIESIVTKEQFESMQYNLEREVN